MAERTVRALLFDFFGTLVDYQPDRSRLGYPLTHQLAVSLGWGSDHDSFVGAWDAASLVLERESRETSREFSMADAAGAFASGAGLRLSAEQLDGLAASFVGEWAQHIRPVPGVTQLVKRLARTWSIAVVSNTHDTDMVPNLLDDMAIRSDVTAVVLSIEHGWIKPHESIYREGPGCHLDVTGKHLARHLVDNGSWHHSQMSGFASSS